MWRADGAGYVREAKRKPSHQAANRDTCSIADEDASL